MNRHRQKKYKSLNGYLRAASQNDMDIREYRALKASVCELKASRCLVKRYGEYEDISNAYVDEILGLMVPTRICIKNKESGIVVVGFKGFERHLALPALPLSESDVAILRRGWTSF
ncbi:hypothetical protein [Reinekea marinisedimentorum]|uniref:Uncharacterized protein n=1 Tax=Reinekea marinisedimentorum TaxID=230495 RepID=A0A4R3HVU7_9GAMM|nr:hypothetical protein [Reinekea marinisedimentorum]TCS36693.1 hypothetical protein BCF53_12315 [Reinekea marinisedimentorum]